MFKPYTYQKGEVVFQSPQRTLPKPRQFDTRALSGPVFALKTIIASALVLSGVSILITKVLVPVVVIHANTVESSPVVSPLSEDSSDANLSAPDNSERFTFKELSSGFMRNVDYREKDGLYYPEFVEEVVEADLPEFFYITIPKLEIYDARVKVNSLDLDPDDALGHYNGTCLPDEACNTFIYGHSTFSGSVNHYEDGDYTAIFKDLGELEYGDEFYIKYKDKEHRYIVELTKIQKPQDVDPLGEPLPRSLGKYENTVELFTCTPAGTTKYRLSVVGREIR